MKISSFSPFGYEGALVSVEVDLRRGIPLVEVIGLADNAIKEARERMRAAIRNCGFEFPLERVLISLSPADVKKEGAGFDLAMALAVLQEKMRVDVESSDSECSENAEAHVQKLVQNFSDNDMPILVMGELELSGKVRPVRGVHAALSTASENGIEFCVIPEENAQEAVGIQNIRIFTVKNLHDAYKLLLKFSSKDFYQKLKLKKTKSKIPYFKNEEVTFSDTSESFNYSIIKGQSELLRALQIAASGIHNIIVCGPPGCGKTLALQNFSALLPRLTLQESLPVTRIYSLAGRLKSGDSLIFDVPFRMPHQSSSLEGMIGGGPNCSPGEISLAHNGVLFLDEASEFKSNVLQTLRVPLEDGKISLSRAGRSTEYPARFQLLVASNPCSCGNFGSEDKICLCSMRSVEQFWRRFSAPLLDRIDIRVSLGPANLDTHSNQKTLTTQELRKPIKIATQIQRKRQGKANSNLTPNEIKEICFLNTETEDYLNEESLQCGFSARGFHSCVKLARTIADMEASKNIELHHMKEAIFFHKNEGGPNIMF